MRYYLRSHILFIFFSDIVHVCKWKKISFFKQQCDLLNLSKVTQTISITYSYSWPIMQYSSIQLDHSSQIRNAHWIDSSLSNQSRLYILCIYLLSHSPFILVYLIIRKFVSSCQFDFNQLCSIDSNSEM